MPSSRRESPIRRGRGFSLIELVVVIVIIGIVAVVALPRLTALFGYNDVGYRNKVKATLEYARKSAIAQRRWACATISDVSVTLTIEKNVPGAIGTCAANPLDLPAKDSACATGNMICVPRNVETSSATALPAAIRFDPQGRPSAGIVLTITDQGSASTSSLTLEAETGYVH